MTPNKTFFKSQQHHDRFVQIVYELGKTWPEQNHTFDPAYASALYILTANRSQWEYVQGFVDKWGIGFEELLGNIDQWSTSEKLLIRWAANLFHPEHVGVAPADLSCLDEDNFKIALTALKLRRYGYQEGA
jgi:hypothetical protein